MPFFADVGRVLAAVAALGLYALNDVRMFHALPREPSAERAYAASLQVWENGAQVYLSAFDLALRWGLAGLTVAACVWAVAETLQRQKAQ